MYNGRLDRDLASRIRIFFILDKDLLFRFRARMHPIGNQTTKPRKYQESQKASASMIHILSPLEF